MAIDPIQWAAFKVLVRRLGIIGAARAGWAIQREAAKGAPFAHLPKAVTPDERGTRAQAGPAILLYRYLVGRRNEAAITITADVVTAGALAFLEKTVGVLDRTQLTAMTATKREIYLHTLGEQFPNAILRWDTTDADQVAFTVLSCRFVGLCHAVGTPELAPVFCAGDAAFFGAPAMGVAFTRPETLATGGERCTFHLQWQDNVEPSQPK